MEGKERRYISVPERWKDGTLLAIPFGTKSQAMIIGVTKARAIIRYIEEIKSFVDDSEDRRHNDRRIKAEEHSGKP